MIASLDHASTETEFLIDLIVYITINASTMFTCGSSVQWDLDSTSIQISAFRYLRRLTVTTGVRHQYQPQLVQPHLIR